MNKAAELLSQNSFTFAAVNGDRIYTSVLRGVAPVIELIDTQPDLLNGASVADKVIGKAAAMLLSAYGVKEIYTPLASKKAIEFLKDKDIVFTFDEVTEYIINRDGTDMCPMEKTVFEISDEKEAERLIRNKIKELRRA